MTTYTSTTTYTVSCPVSLGTRPKFLQLSNLHTS